MKPVSSVLLAASCIASFVGLAASCAAPERIEPEPAISVTVAPRNVYPSLCGSTRLAATVGAPAGIDSGVTWSSSDTTVARVDQASLVHAVGWGSARVVAASRASPSHRDSAAVDVLPPPGPTGVVGPLTYAGTTRSMPADGVTGDVAVAGWFNALWLVRRCEGTTPPAGTVALEVVRDTTVVARVVQAASAPIGSATFTLHTAWSAGRVGGDPLTTGPNGLPNGAYTLRLAPAFGGRTATSAAVAIRVANPPAVRAVLLTPTQASLRSCDSMSFVASVTADAGADRTVLWRIADTTLLRGAPGPSPQALRVTTGPRSGVTTVTAVVRADTTLRATAPVVIAPLALAAVTIQSMTRTGTSTPVAIDSVAGAVDVAATLPWYWFDPRCALTTADSSGRLDLVIDVAGRDSVVGSRVVRAGSPDTTRSVRFTIDFSAHAPDGSYVFSNGLHHAYLRLTDPSGRTSSGTPQAFTVWNGS